jgi:hypothetical protein
VIHPPLASFGLGFSSLASIAKQWRACTLPGDFLAAVPSFVFGGDTQAAPPPNRGYMHAPASAGAALSP